MGEAYLTFAEQEPGFYAAMFSPRPSDGEPGSGSHPTAKAPEPDTEGAFGILVKALSETFPDGFKDVDVRFIAVEVWALSHGIATLDAAGQLPRGSGMPDKYELLRAGVLALVHGALKKAF
jgi:hypothetical protein